ncbi:hypothetical protein B0H10DRAFT_2436601 [Mycena sp. CBHHK59/15]|nr:hypothetical protein B0H10DRAFT_2436601 [Mycena sp. CBHHK59/15]
MWALLSLIDASAERADESTQPIFSTRKGRAKWYGPGRGLTWWGARAQQQSPHHRARITQRGVGGPAREPSVRSPPGSNRLNAADAPPPPNESSRLTEIYDDYLDAHTDDPPPMPAAPPPQDRVVTWVRTNAAPATGLARPTLSEPTTYAPSSTQAAYEEEEEEYASGEHHDAPFDLIKIRVKLHNDDDVRWMALVPETPFEEFMEKVTGKLNTEINGLMLKFKDEDGVRVSLRDESDYELAIETARESAKGKPEGKLEV